MTKIVTCAVCHREIPEGDENLCAECHRFFNGESVVEDHTLGNTNKKPYINKYQTVKNRCVTRSGKGGVGISFDTPEGETIRLHLILKDAVSFCTALNSSLFELSLRIPHVEEVRNA